MTATGTADPDLRDFLHNIGATAPPTDEPRVHWTRFPDAFGKRLTRHADTWSDLVDQLRNPRDHPSKAAMPLLKLATFGEHKNAKGVLRHDGNVIEVHGVEGDYDGGEVTLDQALERLEHALVKAVVYTSPSHRPEAPRWRVLAPLSKPHPPAARSALLARINGALGGILAPESFTLSQTYYFGRVSGTDYQCAATWDDPDEGHYVDELDHLDAIAIGKVNGTHHADEGGDDRRVLYQEAADKVATLGRKLRTGDSRRELLKSYIASRSAKGFAAFEVRALVDAFAAEYFDPSDPIDEADVRTLVEHFTGKDQAKDKPAPGAVPKQSHIHDIAPAFSDDALALEFVRVYGVGFRWSHGFGWMRDAGAHWDRDDSLTRYQCARLVCRSASKAGGLKDPDRRRIDSAKTRNAVLDMAQSDPEIVVPSEAWDRDPFALNTPAGVVDLRTGKMRHRTGEDYFTQCTGVAPSTAVSTANWLRFVGEVFSGDMDMVEFLQRVLGYCLTGDRREHKLFFAHGSGSNGKSTLLDLVQSIMGVYALKLPASVLMQSQHERHPTELAQLRGKRLAISNELDEGHFWAESRIKELTGDEYLNARFMRQDNFVFTQTQKHLIAGNYKPRLRGGDPAMARRMVLIPFLETFEGTRKDSALPLKLKAEAPGVLAWMIEGARKWHADGLATPPKVAAASRDYMAEHDDLALFIEECCTRNMHEAEKASDLYQAFAAWKRDRGEHAPSQTAWGQKMALLPGVRKVRSNGSRYEGIRLLPEVRDRLNHESKR